MADRFTGCDYAQQIKNPQSKIKNEQTPSPSVALQFQISHIDFAAGLF